MKLTHGTHTPRLLLSIVLIALVSCASPTRPNPDGAGTTGSSQVEASASSAPRFAPDGPNAEEYGATEGYPIKVSFRARFFVGMFSHYDQSRSRWRSTGQRS
jgi:hypothetical protein